MGIIYLNLKVTGLVSAGLISLAHITLRSVCTRQLVGSREGPGRKRYCCKVIRDVQKEKAPSNKRCIKSNGLVCSKNLTGGATGGGFCLGDGVQVFPGEDCQH